jgi:hypothetical protein
MSEVYCVSDYLTNRSAPSDLVEGEIQRLPAIFACPNCGKEHPRPAHCEEEFCECGLHWQRRGNYLKIWRAPTANELFDEIEALFQQEGIQYQNAKIKAVIENALRDSYEHGCAMGWPEGPGSDKKWQRR